jgi:hypothetical protein
LWRAWWNVDWQGKPKFSEKTCPSAIFVHHKIPRAHPGLNAGRRGGKPVTNSLSYGAAGISNYLGFIVTFLFSSEITAKLFRIDWSWWLQSDSFPRNVIETCLWMFSTGGLDILIITRPVSGETEENHENLQSRVAQFCGRNFWKFRMKAGKCYHCFNLLAVRCSGWQIRTLYRILFCMLLILVLVVEMRHQDVDPYLDSLS